MDVDYHAESIGRMSRDLREAAKVMTEQEARYLVDSYYAMQESRIREAHRLRIMSSPTANGNATEDAEVEPHAVISWLTDQNGTLENQVKLALNKFAGAHPVGEWAMKQVGIGPVISAGLLAHLDPTYPTVGHIYRFCGLDPTVVWNKGEKRPWSHSAKQIAFKIGDSMVKQSNHPKCLYGAIYRARKEVETRRNNTGRYARIAEATLASGRRFSAEQKKHYESGKLPPGRIDLRARRVAVKLFLSHWHTVAFYHATGMAPPVPYALAMVGHAHYIPPPDFDPRVFPRAERLREPRPLPLSELVEKVKERSRQTVWVTDIEEAARVVREVE
jgi:hypothetical protein